MPELPITCPNSACAQPLKLPTEALGKPLSCPYCRAELNVTLTGSGEVESVEMLRKGGMRVPRHLLVPGFVLLILGFAGFFVNGYLGVQCKLKDGFALEYARNRVQDLRNGEELTSSRKKDDDEKDEKAKQAKKAKDEKREATPEELFGALAGSAATSAMRADADERTALGWAPWIYPSRLVFIGISAISALGGLCMLLGRGYILAMLGCIAGILNINELGCCFIGAIAGVWGILVLVRDDGRRYFRIAPKS